jgi:hypothetical protein
MNPLFIYHLYKPSTESGVNRNPRKSDEMTSYIEKASRFIYYYIFFIVGVVTFILLMGMFGLVGLIAWVIVVVVLVIWAARRRKRMLESPKSDY